MIKILLEIIELIQLASLINILTERSQEAYEILVILGLEQLLLPFKKVYQSFEALIHNLISCNFFLLGLTSKLLNLNDPILFLEESLKFNKDFTPSRYFLSVFLFQSKNYTDSSKHIEEVINKKGIFVPESLNVMGCVQSKNSFHLKALDYFQQSVQLKLTDDVIYNLTIEYQIIKERFSYLKMLEFLYKHIRRPENDSLTKLSTIEYSQIEILYDLAKSSLYEKRLEYSISAFEKVIASLKDDSIWGKLKDPPLKVYQYYIEALLEIQDYEKAIDSCDKILSYYKSSKILLHKSDALFCIEKIDESLKVLNEAIELSKKENDQNAYSIACNNKGIILVCCGKVNEALVCFKLSSDTLESKFNQCNLLIQMQKYTEACILWFKARKIRLDQDNNYYMTLYDSGKINLSKLDKEAIESHVSGSLSLYQTLVMDLRVFEFKLTMKEEKFLVIAERILS